MQIHEITRRRTDEGILSGIKNTIGKAATAVAQTAAGSVLDAAGVSKDLQGWNQGMKATPGQTQAQAYDIGQSLIAPTAKTLSANWQKALTNWAGESPDPLNPDFSKFKNRMSETLDTMINQNLLNNRFDWREFTRIMRAVPQRSLPAKTAQDQIGRAKAEIMALTNKSRPQDIENAFTNLVTGAFKAINLYQTAPSSGTAMVGSDKLSQQLAATKMTSKQMNMNQTQEQGLYDALKSSPQGIKLYTAITGKNPPGAKV